MKPTIIYNLGRFEIRINIWALIIFLILQTALNELGFWQLSRAHEKQNRLIQLQKGEDNPRTNLALIGDKELEQFQAVKLDMMPSGSSLYYLDNQVHEGRPGYHVLQLAQDKSSEQFILVNRGWVFAGNSRERLPDVEFVTGDWEVAARAYPLPEKAISTARAQTESLGRNLRLPVIDKKTLVDIGSELRIDLATYILRVNPDNQGALTAEWKWTNMPPEKHLAYAIQWFACALALLIISLIVCIKKKVN